MPDSTATTTGLEAAICEQATEVCCKAFGQRLDAIVLTGSLARHEATCLTEGQGTRVLGDAEFFLVFKAQASLPSKSELDMLIDRIRRRLDDQKISCYVEFAPVYPEYFRRLRPAIFAYELKASGRTVWGDASVLSLIPPFSVEEIPREDAWRLLMNRMIECLEITPELLKAEVAATEKLRYRLVKLCLDMTTSFLVFAGDYRPTYQARDEALRQIAERDEEMGRSPLPLLAFSKQVSACTEFKLRGCTDASRSAANRRKNMPSFRVLEHVRPLWRWELVQLSGAPATFSDHELVERWMHQQAVSSRLRGWLVVLRACGWHRSWRNWNRWARLACQASPRYWVYAAASAVFFSLVDGLLSRLPEGNGNDAMLSKVLIESLRSALRCEQEPARRRAWKHQILTLPIVSQATRWAGCPEWVQLVTGIADNYHRFVEHTKS